MSAISTGTDMKTYHGMQHPEQCYYPLVPGYENMGVVVEEGSYAPGFKKGDRVMINECRKYLGTAVRPGAAVHCWSTRTPTTPEARAIRSAGYRTM